MHPGNNRAIKRNTIVVLVTNPSEEKSKLKEEKKMKNQLLNDDQ